MEAVFSSGDIVKQLPVEAKRFQNIDKSYMKVLVESSFCKKCCYFVNCRCVLSLRDPGFCTTTKFV